MFYVEAFIPATPLLRFGFNFSCRRLFHVELTSLAHSIN